MDNAIQTLDKRLTAELVEYIKDEMGHGYNVDAIKRSMMNFEQDQNIIDTAIDEVLKKNSQPKKRVAKHEKLEKDAFYEIIFLLKGYIEQQNKRGYKQDQIKEALLNYGHMEHVVESAFGMMKDGSIPKYEEPSQWIDIETLKVVAFPFSLVSFGLLLIIFTFVTQGNLLRMIVLFFPVILSILSVKLFFSSTRNKRILVLFPLFFTIVFFVLGFTKTKFFTDIQLNDLTALNFLFSLIYFYLLYMIDQKQSPPSSSETTPKLQKDIHADVKKQLGGDSKHPHLYTPSERLKHIELKSDEKKKMPEVKE